MMYYHTKFGQRRQQRRVTTNKANRKHQHASQATQKEWRVLMVMQLCLTTTYVFNLVLFVFGVTNAFDTSVDIYIVCS